MEQLLEPVVVGHSFSEPKDYLHTELAKIVLPRASAMLNRYSYLKDREIFVASIERQLGKIGTQA